MRNSIPLERYRIGCHRRSAFLTNSQCVSFGWSSLESPARLCVNTSLFRTFFADNFTLLLICVWLTLTRELTEFTYLILFLLKLFDYFKLVFLETKPTSLCFLLTGITGNLLENVEQSRDSSPAVVTENLRILRLSFSRFLVIAW